MASTMPILKDDQRREKIARLLDEHGARIYGLCLRLTGEPSRAEDLMQETFLQAFRKWDQFRGEAKASTWLHTIAVRRFLRMKRRRSGEPARVRSLDRMLPFDSRAVPVVPGDGQTPLESALRREAVRELEQAIVDLPPEYRLPLVLKEIAGFSVVQAAEVLGLKEATVKTRLHRARAMLYKAVTSVLPQKSMPPAAYTKRVCMDLLRAKQESLDKGVAFPMPAGDFCQRCRAVFEGMDLGQELCRKLAAGSMPRGSRQAILRDLDGSA